MLLRDRLLARLEQMGPDPDYVRLASEVLGIRNAPLDLARRLVSQALVVEDRAAKWQAIGEHICREAPPGPGVYVLRDADDVVLYVGKAISLRRRLRAHFSRRRWKGLKADFARACQAEWIEVGSEIEALLREGALIEELQPTVNVQLGAPLLETRTVPPAIVRDVLVIVPSVEPDSVELIGARTDGGWMIQRTARSGADLVVHVPRLTKFFSPLRRAFTGPPLAPIVFSWLAGRGATETRLDPHTTPRVLREALAALLGDKDLFAGRIIQTRQGSTGSRVR